MNVLLKDGREWKFVREDGCWFYRTRKTVYRLFFDVDQDHPHIWIGIYDPKQPCWFRAPNQFMCIEMLGGHYVWG